jgi:hypothetical protein
MMISDLSPAIQIVYGERHVGEGIAAPSSLRVQARIFFASHEAQLT